MILAVDGTGLLHTYFHVNDDKDPDDLLERFLTRLYRLKAHFDSTIRRESVRCFVVFDNGGTTFRKCLYPGYKAGRERYTEFDIAHAQAKEAVGYAQSLQGFLAPAGYEADDVMATIAARASERVVLHSADKDMHQCLEAGRVVIIKRSRVDVGKHALDIEYFSEKDLIAKFGISPDRWIDYQCLVGDTSDAVYGANRIGPKTARAILEQYTGRLEEANIYRLPLTSSQRSGWTEFKERLPVLREVFRLHSFLKLDVDGFLPVGEF